MAESFTRKRFPRFAEQIRNLAIQHRSLEDEPLHLALSYDPEREGQNNDIFLFEVVSNFGDNEISPDGDLFEVTFNSSNDLQLGPDQQLHLIITNPREIETAIQDQWPLLEELRRAITAGNYEELYADESGKDILGRLQ